MEKATPKLRKKTFTIVEQACHEIHGFSKLYQELQDKVTLRGQTQSTLKNYARKLAHLSIHFGKLPHHIDEREKKLPVVLNRAECRALFKAPELLKHRVMLSFRYRRKEKKKTGSRYAASTLDMIRIYARNAGKVKWSLFNGWMRYAVRRGGPHEALFITQRNYVFLIHNNLVSFIEKFNGNFNFK